MADRTLKLVTKTIQNMANLVEFKAKESFMIYLNPFIKEYMPRMRRFVNQISVRADHPVTCMAISLFFFPSQTCDEYPESAELNSQNPAKDLSTIFNLCQIYKDSLHKLATDQVKGMLLVKGRHMHCCNPPPQPEVGSLIEVIQALRMAEKRYTNKIRYP